MKVVRTFILYLEFIFKNRALLLKGTGIITLVGLVICLLLPNKYTAVATVMPPDLFSGTLGFSFGQSPGISQYISAGRLLGMPSISEVFVSVMKSNRVQDTIINRFALIKEFKAKNIEDARKSLSAITRINITPEGIITISVTHKKRELAVDIANAYWEELDRFNSEIAMTAGKKYRIFIEKRLKETKDSLFYAENELNNFLKKYRIAALDAEIPSAISTVAKLKSEIVLKEIQRDALLQTATPDNPYLQEIEQELNEYKNHLARIERGTKTKEENFGVGFSIPFARVPELLAEYTRLLRNAKIYEAVYELLAQQYEQAKIMEVKDTPTIQILDRAQIPLRKSWPRRTQIVILSLIIGFIIMNFIAALNETFRQIKTEPEEWKKITRIYNYLKDDFRKLKDKISAVLHIKH